MGKLIESSSLVRPTIVYVVALVAVIAGAMPVQVSAQPSARQSTLFVNNCVQCHAHPETGAPFIGSAEDWQDAVTRGEDAMLINVVQGIGGMPPLGYCSACSEEDLRVLIRMVTGVSDFGGEQQ